MPKNTKGGKNKPDLDSGRYRPMPLRDEEEDFDLDYAVVTKKLGNGQLLSQLSGDGREIIAVLRGAFKSKKFRMQRLRFEIGSVILIAHREWDKMWENRSYKKDEPGQKREQVDVVHLYSRDQSRKLFKMKQIPKWMIVEEEKDDGVEEDEAGGFVFGDNENINDELDIDDI